MKRPDKGWGVDWKTMKREYDKMDKKLLKDNKSRIAKKTLTVQQATHTHYHILAQNIAKKYGWTYEKKKTR